MTSLKKSIKWIAALIPILIGLFFLILWVQRLLLSYSSEGKYFDEQTGIAYTDSGGAAYGVLALGSLAIGAYLFFFYCEVNNKCESQL